MSTTMQKLRSAALVPIFIRMNDGQFTVNAKPYQRQMVQNFVQIARRVDETEIFLRTHLLRISHDIQDHYSK